MIIKLAFYIKLFFHFIYSLFMDSNSYNVFWRGFFIGLLLGFLIILGWSSILQFFLTVFKLLKGAI